MGSGVIGSHLYVAGGRDAPNTVIGLVWDYNIATDTWQSRAPLPAVNNVPGSAVINGKLWQFGGGNPFLFSGAHSDVTAALLSPETTNVTRIFDPGTNTWSLGPNLNQQRSFAAWTNVGAYVAIAMGGYTGSTTTNSTEQSTTTICGTPTPTITPGGPTPTNTPLPPTATNTPACPAPGWTTMAPYPIPILDSGVASQGTNVYSFAGVSGGVIIATSYKYDTTTNTWTGIAALTAPREEPSAVSDGTYLYILGGWDTLGAETTTLYRYDPVSNSYTTMAPYTTATSAQSASYYVARSTASRAARPTAAARRRRCRLHDRLEHLGSRGQPADPDRLEYDHDVQQLRLGCGRRGSGRDQQELPLRCGGEHLG